jgi:hypothetical protein
VPVGILVGQFGAEEIRTWFAVLYVANVDSDMIVSFMTDRATGSLSRHGKIMPTRQPRPHYIF